MAYFSLAAFAARSVRVWRTRREQRRTRRILERLPASIRRDIGWQEPEIRPHTGLRL